LYAAGASCATLALSWLGYVEGALSRGSGSDVDSVAMKRCKFVELSTLEYLDELSSTWRRAYEIPTGAEECWSIASELN
jgi:hypothetical protein